MSPVKKLGLSAILLVSGSAVARERVDWKDLKPLGEAVQCLRVYGLGPSHVRSDQVIDFEIGRKLYRNTLPSPCPELGFERSFSFRTPISQLCSGDTITVFHHSMPGIPGASCALGTFQPLAPANG